MVEGLIWWDGLVSSAMDLIFIYSLAYTNWTFVTPQHRMF